MEGRILGTFEALTQHLGRNMTKANKQQGPVSSRERSMRCDHSTMKSGHNNVTVQAAM
jgi:hypothetical protein